MPQLVDVDTIPDYIPLNTPESMAWWEARPVLKLIGNVTNLDLTALKDCLKERCRVGV